MKRLVLYKNALVSSLVLASAFLAAPIPPFSTVALFAAKDAAHAGDGVSAGIDNKLKPAVAGKLTFDEKLVSGLQAGERAGIIRHGALTSDRKTITVLTVEKYENGSNASEAPPRSRIAIFDGAKVLPVTEFGEYIEALEVRDLDGDGILEAVFATRSGMKRLLEVSALKFDRNSGSGAFAFRFLFRSEGVADGKFDIVNGAKGELPGLLIGGFLNAPGASEPHVEFTYTYSYNNDPKKPRLALVKKFTTAPKTISQEYEYAYMYLLEGNRAEAARRLGRLCESLKNTKSQNNLQILRACEDALKACEKAN